ncbi:MAG: hypothetical protein U0T82_15370 [Bacteroidales bacterium]
MKKRTLVISLFLIPFLAQAQDYTPVAKVSKGQEYRYQSSILSENTQTMGGQESKNSAKVKSTQVNTIEDIKVDGTISVLTSVWDIETSAQMNGIDTTIAIPGKAGDVTRNFFNSSGGALRKEIAEAATGSPGMNSGLNSGMTYTALFTDFPSKTLKPGDKWTREGTDTITQAGFGGSMVLKVNTEYTYRGKTTDNTSGFFAVTYSSNLEITGTGSMQGMDLNIEGSGMRIGTVTFDPANGITQQDKGTTELEMTISISGPTNMTLPITQKLEITSSLVK